MSARNPISQKIQTIYQRNFLIHRDTPAGTFQNDRVTQYLRFERLLNNFLPFNSPTHPYTDTPIRLLDVGCGTADLHEYLLQQNIRHEYTGLEIVMEMSEIAKKKFPEIKIINSDLLEFSSKKKFDLVLQSGAFNMPSVKNKNAWKNYCRKIVIKMYSLARTGIAFNSLTTYNTFTDKSLFYFSPEEWFSFCQKNLSRYIIMDHAYPLYETAITVFRPDYIKTLHPARELKKYHKN